jgi:ribosomal protein S18 acetylase RimI-like enzyme
MAEVHIRRATAADAETLSAIGAATFTETFGHLYPAHDLSVFLAEAYGLEGTHKDLADPAKASWLAECEGETIGYATVGPCGLPSAAVTPACGEIKRIYFLKRFQNQGLGARLFDLGEAWLLKHGPRTIWIGVWSENFGAQRFYERRGYARAGEYGFKVGATTDHEFILKKDAGAFAAERESAKEADPA